MPILAAETDIFPEDLLDRDAVPADGSCRWWAVYTRSRQEKHLMRGLLALSIPFYCPIIPHRFRSPSGRARVSHLPLFSNYLFMQADGHDRYRALTTNLISKTIEVEDDSQLVHDLRQIQRLIRTGSPLTVEARLQVGTKVRIKSGPLVGVEGIVLKRQGTNHLFVAVNFLQQGALVKLEDFEVEPVI
jgi:transcriptional antiterminator RfaH